jgi:hypothetical protein
MFRRKVTMKIIATTSPCTFIWPSESCTEILLLLLTFKPVWPNNATEVFLRNWHKFFSSSIFFKYCGWRHAAVYTLFIPIKWYIHFYVSLGLKTVIKLWLTYFMPVSENLCCRRNVSIYFPKHLPKNLIIEIYKKPLSL